MESGELSITPVVRDMQHGDADILFAAFQAIGWNKPLTLFKRYLEEHINGIRVTLIGLVPGSSVQIAGYGTVVWHSHYPPFAEAGIPEIVDLNVLPDHRRLGVATAIMDRAEQLIAARARQTSLKAVAGIGVGLYADYGAAQRMYVRRGYLPDGRGAMYNGVVVPPGESRPVDDALNIFLTKDL